jgi:C1A family cysteine protease
MENHLNVRFKIRKSSSITDDYQIYKNNTNKLLQPVVDLRKSDTFVEDQLSLGSCSSAALTSAYELAVKLKNPDEYVELSDLFIYYNAREKEGTIYKDEGIYIRTGLEVMKEYGVCEESLWPYDLEKWDDKPPYEAYENAKKRKIIDYKRLISIYYMTEVLNDNKPVVFGMEIYDNFMRLNESNNTVSLPSRKEKNLGGHAMCMVGYDLDNKLFLSKNSFGTDWGMKGYCWIPFDYIKQEGYDCWTFDISPQPGESNVLR